MNITDIKSKLEELQEENAFNDSKSHDFQEANSLNFRAVLNITQTTLPEQIKYFEELADLSEKLKNAIKQDRLTHINAEIISASIHQMIKAKEVKFQDGHE